MTSRSELDGLIVQRDEVSARHALAVALLEEQGPDHAIDNRRKCARLYDELVAVQRRIDDYLSAERSR